MTPSRILYVGQPGTEREAHFAAFLGEHFAAVRTASVVDIGRLDLTDVDVVVVDGEPLKGDQPPKELTAEALPLPTVLIGGVGGKVSDAIGLKLGWQYGCLCLDNRAILEEQTLEHPVFRGPHAVPVPVAETIPSPENFLLYSGSKDVPEKVAVVQVHEGRPLPTDEEAAELQARVQAAVAAGDHAAVMAMIAEQPTVGLVSTSAGFFDSPDCERILGGINQKAHDYVAVGRQARFLAWGFHGDPSVMTAWGSALFLNAIHYIAGYAGAPVEALRLQWSRDMLHASLGFLDQAESGDPVARLASIFGAIVPDGVGTTTAEALAWYDENRGYVHRTGSGHSGSYEFDPDLVGVGIGNDAPRLLDVLAPLLSEATDEGERARRLWQRYVRRDPVDAGVEQQWLAEHRGSMFFSDWAGYRWIARNDLPTLVAPRLGQAEDGPVTVSLAAERVGDDLELAVSFHLRPGFYLYAPGAADGIPVAIAVSSEHELVSGPDFPASDDFHLSGYVTVPLRVRGVSDEVELAVTVQACDEQSCTPPVTLTLRGTAGG